MQTKVPWVANKASFFPVDKKSTPILISIMAENIQQNNPANATVKFWCFFSTYETENIEKPIAEISQISPGKVFCSELSNAIMHIPAATIIAIHTVIEIFSFKNKTK